jgi:hypothetical protein
MAGRHGNETATMLESSMIMKHMPDAQSRTRKRRPLTQRLFPGRTATAALICCSLMAI